MTKRTTDMPGTSVRQSPFVIAGPWLEEEEAEDGGDIWRAEIQVVGGHAFVATVYGDSPEEAQGRAELAIEAWTTRALDACASVQKERDELREMLGEAIGYLHDIYGEDLCGDRANAPSVKPRLYTTYIDWTTRYHVRAFLARYEALK